MFHPAVFTYFANFARRLTSTAPYPFNIKAPDSLTLRAADGVEYHVPRTSLSIASAGFGGTIEAGHRPLLLGLSETSSSDDTDSTADVIDIEEGSETLSALLRTISSATDSGPPAITTIEANIAVLEAAKKYKMPLIVQEARKQLEAKAGKQPLEVYAILLARPDRVGLEDEIRMAGMLSLKQILSTSNDHPAIPQFERISHGDYTRLLDYRKACSAAVASLFRQGGGDRSAEPMPLYICTFLHNYVVFYGSRVGWLFTTKPDIEDYQVVRSSRHSPGLAADKTKWAKIITGLPEGTTRTAPQEIFAARWWAEWMMEAVEKLICLPHPATMTDEFFNGLLVKAISTQPYEMDVPIIIKHFRDVFTEAVRRAVDKVKLDIVRN